MGDSQLCLLLLLSTSALAFAQDEDVPTCLLATRYKTLHKYEYRYEAESLNAINGASTLKNGPKGSCMVQIEVPQTCSYIVRTTGCMLSEVADMDTEGNLVFRPAAGSDAFAAEMEKYPLKVVVDGVYDVKLYPEEGICPNVKSFLPVREHTSPLALISGMHYPLSQLVRSSQTCNYKFDNENKHMTSGSCTERHILIPFSNKGEYGVTNVGKQELTLVEVTPHNDRVFDHSEVAKGLHMEAVQDKTAVQDKDAGLNLLRELTNLPEAEGERRAHLFHKLVTMVRGMKAETLSPAIPEALEVSPVLTYQVLAQCGTPECSSGIMQILRTFDSSAVEVDAAVFALGLVSNPSALLINDMLEMAKYKTSKPILYALSNIVKRNTLVAVTGSEVMTIPPTVTDKVDVQSPTEAVAMLKYNRRRNVVTADLQIPDYDVEAGLRLGVVDGNTKGKGTHSISLDFVNKNIPQLSLVGRANLKAMKEAMLQVQLLVPSLNADATVTAHMSMVKNWSWSLRVKSKKEAVSKQKMPASLRVEFKSDVNTQTTMLPSADMLEKYANQLLDAHVGEADMKVRHIFQKFGEAANNYMDKYGADLPYIQNEAKASYYFNNEHFTITIPLPLGGKTTEELNFPAALTTPSLSLPQFGLEIVSMEIPIPELVVPKHLALSIPLFGKAEVSSLMIKQPL
ncbi:unnamed protein product [Pleuronectes platessa]|uniref:Vitellogenin domain-containing protein n=1 Tax=Pleuronectes platessa TaxID=8262 RepID=A0A9N7V419_PLEPL|nr:unnamed protein product [Pleuronectes platessa]